MPAISIGTGNSTYSHRNHSTEYQRHTVSVGAKYTRHSSTRFIVCSAYNVYHPVILNVRAQLRSAQRQMSQTIRGESLVVTQYTLHTERVQKLVKVANSVEPERRRCGDRIDHVDHADQPCPGQFQNGTNRLGTNPSHCHPYSDFPS